MNKLNLMKVGDSLQKYYNEDNIALNYVCAYAKLLLEKEGLKFINLLTGQVVLLQGNYQQLTKIVDSLYLGVSDSFLIELLNNISKKNNGEDIYKTLILTGMIE